LAERHELNARIESLAREITKLRRTLAPLARFRTIIDQGDEAIMVIDPETDRFVDANQTALRWLGLKRKDLLTLTVHDVDVEFPLGFPEACTATATDKRNHQRPWVCGRVHRRRDGTSFPVEVAVAPRRIGDRTYTLVVARESRQHRQIERAIREAEDRYHTLFNLTQDAVYLTARDGSISEVNEAALDLLGYTRQELIGLQARQLYAELPDTRLFQVSVEENGFVRDLAVRLRAKDGALISGLLTVSPRRSSGEAVGGYQCLVRLAHDDSLLRRTPVVESSDEVTAGEADCTAVPETTAPVAETGAVPGMSGEAREQQPLDLEAGGRPLPKYAPAPLFDSASKWHYRPWPLVLVLGAVVALFGWSDLAVLTYPYNSGLPVWQLGVRVLALTLLALGIAGPAWWRAARGVATGVALLGITLLVAYVDYVRGFPFELGDAVPDTQPALRSAILGASGFAVALLLFCGWVSWCLWTGARRKPTRS
jgi:PAS domain S-box-containing protein